MKNLLTLCLLMLCGIVHAEDIVVRDSASLRQIVLDLKAGTTLKLAPGEYPGGHYVSGVDQLTIEALDPKNAPHFQGGTNAWQFSRCNNLTLRHLRISGQSGNGLNLDDGGQFDRPVTGITLEHLQISDIGPRGNHDGIKCSGVDTLTIGNCTLTGWGGQAIDLVRCHQSRISNCRFEGKPAFSATAGVQTKGGSADVTIENCQFRNAGERPLNVGGSTGLNLFRPSGANYEARRIVVRNNIIEGSSCAAAFVGVDGAEFTGNTIRYPTKWVFRILQETTVSGYVPCRNVIVQDNTILFRRSQVQTEINIGGGTDPASFRFERNQWFAVDQPQASKPRLPSEEQDGIYGVDPR